jgi:hypothetical protein
MLTDDKRSSADTEIEAFETFTKRGRAEVKRDSGATVSTVKLMTAGTPLLPSTSLALTTALYTPLGTPKMVMLANDGPVNTYGICCKRDGEAYDIRVT